MAHAIGALTALLLPAVFVGRVPHKRLVFVGRVPRKRLVFGVLALLVVQGGGGLSRFHGVEVTAKKGLKSAVCWLDHAPDDPIGHRSAPSSPLASPGAIQR